MLNVLKMKISRFIKSAQKTIGYFGDHSSLHGMRYIFSSKHIPYPKRTIWMIFVSVSALGMLYILNQSIHLFESETISYVPETTYLSWQTDFPAVTVCEAADTDKLGGYYEEHKIPVQLTTIYEELMFLDSQHYCRSCSSCDDMDCPKDPVALMKEFRSPCNETIARCSWRGVEFECCERFKSIQTEYGECFIFNSGQLEKEKLHVSNKLTGPGYLKFYAMEAIMLDVHSPNDITFSHFDKQIINGNEGDLPFASEFELIFKVEDIKNEAGVELVDPNVRGCRMSYEQTEGPHPYRHYSHSACIVECRAERQLESCNCTHYMLPRLANEPMCNIKGLVCLTKLIEKSNEDDADLECDCLPSCEEPDYNIVFIKKRPNTEALTDELIERGTLISITMDCLPSTRVRRLVVRTHLDFVVFIGGTAGIFFGASILSVLEIIYLFFIRKYD